MMNLQTTATKIRNICIAYESEAKDRLKASPNLEEKDILPLIALLPLQERTEEQELLSAALLFFWLSRECHGEVKNKDSQHNAAAVLFGDLFYSAAYKILESNENREEEDIFTEIAAIIVRYNEAWFQRQAIKDPAGADPELCQKIIEADLGGILDLAARKGAEEGKYSDAEIRLYRDCAHYLSLIWGQYRYGFTLDLKPAQDSALAAASKLGLDKEIREILAIFE